MNNKKPNDLERITISVAKECIAVEVPDLEKLIKQFDIKGHVEVMRDNKIYFIIDELKRKYYA